MKMTWKMTIHIFTFNSISPQSGIKSILYLS
jgi:hypothetical protein